MGKEKYSEKNLYQCPLFCNKHHIDLGKEIKRVNLNYVLRYVIVCLYVMLLWTFTLRYCVPLRYVIEHLYVMLLCTFTLCYWVPSRHVIVYLYVMLLSTFTLCY